MIKDLEENLEIVMKQKLLIPDTLQLDWDVFNTFLQQKTNMIFEACCIKLNQDKGTLTQ